MEVYFSFPVFNTPFFVSQDDRDDHDAEKFCFSSSRLFLLSYLIVSTYIYYKDGVRREAKLGSVSRETRPHFFTSKVFDLTRLNQETSEIQKECRLESTYYIRYHCYSCRRRKV